MKGVAAIFLTAAAGVGALFGAHPGDIKKDMRGNASTTVRVSVDISCVASAVAAREASLGAAMTTETGAINTAYSARASALGSAYQQSDNAAIRTAVKKAWADFNAAIRVGRKNWNTSQQTTWKTFNAAVRACGGKAADVSDSANASADASAAGTI